MRETREEIGLAPDRVEVLGEQPHYITVTGYRVTPVVGLVTPPLDLKLDEFEVAEVFRGAARLPARPGEPPAELRAVRRPRAELLRDPVRAVLHLGARPPAC